MALVPWQPAAGPPALLPHVAHLQALGPGSVPLYGLVQQIRAIHSTSRASQAADVNSTVPLFVGKGVNPTVARKVAAAETQFSSVLQSNFRAAMPGHRRRLDAWYQGELNVFVVDTNIDNAWYRTAGTGAQVVLPEALATATNDLLLHELVHAYDTHLRLAGAEPYTTDRALMNFELLKATAGQPLGKLMTDPETVTVGLEMFYNVNMRFASLTPQLRYMIGSGVTREVLRARFPYTFGFFSRYYRGLDDLLAYSPDSIREVAVSGPGWLSPPTVTERRVPAPAFEPAQARTKSRAGWELQDAIFAAHNLPLVEAADRAGYRRSHANRPFKLAANNRELLAKVAAPDRSAPSLQPAVMLPLGLTLVALGAGATVPLALVANQQRLSRARRQLQHCERMAESLGDLTDASVTFALARARKALSARQVIMFPDVWSDELSMLEYELRDQANVADAVLRPYGG